MTQQISCVTSTPALSDRERFPNYFQFLPSNTEFATLYFGIIKEFNWRHVGILVQDENLFTAVCNSSLITIECELLVIVGHLRLGIIFIRLCVLILLLIPDRGQTEGVA